ncbi:MAG: 2-oxoacid:acceptor oxidoreductase subunit alpha [Thermotogae bacterium]|nr:2-oxoacid:acceptor oxidoreductase subunit alpha [Thermotogota bacterium]
MRKNDIAIKIAGLAGDGSLTTGEMLSKVLKKMGLYVTTIKDFPSNIRGLPTNMTVRAKYEPVYGPKDTVDYLIAFHVANLYNHAHEVAPGGVIIYDTSVKPFPDELRRDDVFIYELPLAKKAREELGLEIIKNVVAVGIVGEVLGFKHDLVHKVIAAWFKEKGEKIIKKNIDAYELGRKLASQYEKRDEYVIEDLGDPGRVMMVGNEAITLGALAAGVRFEAAYPITPASEILEMLALYLPHFNGAVVQAEDEIAAINFALGAAYAGVRSMTSTSGPGMSLKTETFGLAYNNETPVVIVDSQRAGPSTGLPTKTEQSDVHHALFGGHGDVLRVVIAPATLEEGFYLTAEAFNLAEKYQTPVIILTEQAFAQNKFTAEPDALDPYKVKIDRGKLIDREEAERYAKEGKQFLRYEITEDGVSPRSIPGYPGTFFNANSNEHDETGYTTEDIDMRKRMVDKRLRKYMTALKNGDLPAPVYSGDENAEVGIIGFGATMGPILEAMEQLKDKGIPTRFMRLRTLMPLHEDEVRDFISKHRYVFVVELNALGQLYNYLKRYTTEHDKLHSITKYVGQMFRPREIAEAIEKVVKG